MLAADSFWIRFLRAPALFCLVLTMFCLSVFPEAQALQAKKSLLCPPLKASFDRLKTPSEKAFVLLQEGAKLHADGDIAGAEQRFADAVALDKQSVDGFYNLGAIAETRGDLRVALGHYQSGLKIKPLDTGLKEAVDTVSRKIAMKPAVETFSGSSEEDYFKDSEDYLAGADGLMPVVLEKKSASLDLGIHETPFDLDESPVVSVSMSAPVVPPQVSASATAPLSASLNLNNQPSYRKQIARAACKRALGMIVRQGISIGIRAAIGGSSCGGGGFGF
ncbi:MAG: hypothetical protein K8F91_23505 [Candidatus Obscuribacterales bacterium]|nr:hypothetical protein [Candidatus Obscuribacterales bacterium]